MMRVKEKQYKHNELRRVELILQIVRQETGKQNMSYCCHCGDVIETKDCHRFHNVLKDCDTIGLCRKCNGSVTHPVKLLFQYIDNHGIPYAYRPSYSQ